MFRSEILHLPVSLFKSGVSQGGRPAKCFNVQMPISRQTLQQCVELLDKFLISLFVQVWLLTWLCVFITPTGGGETGSPPPKSGGFVNDSREYFGGRGIARLPSSSQLPRVHLRRRCVFRRRKDCTQAFLFTTSACTSEEEGKAFFLTKWASSSEEEGQVLLLAMSVSTCSSCFVVS